MSLLSASCFILLLRSGLIAWILFFTCPALAQQPPEVLPWKINKPIVTVKKELYVKHPRPLAAALASQHYVGPKLERLEYQGLEVADDVPANHRSQAK